jgi:hypothetical protein
MFGSFSRTYGLQATTVYSGRGADIVYAIKWLNVLRRLPLRGQRGVCSGLCSDYRLEGLGLRWLSGELIHVFSVSAIECKTVQNARIELLISGLQVRVLPGSPL